jgi:DNA-binding NarL/FixJ family response regulator
MQTLWTETKAAQKDEEGVGVNMKLSKVTKDLIRLAHNAGFSVKEIAQLTERSEWTVADYVGSLSAKTSCSGLDMAQQPCPTLSLSP